MKTTNHALLVLTPYTRNHASLLRAAKEVLAKNGQLSVLYVTPKIPAVAYHVPEIAFYAQMQEDIANGVLDELAQNLHIPAENLFMQSGPIKYISKHIAKNINANMVIADFASWREQETSTFINDAINDVWQQMLKWGMEPEVQPTAEVKH